MAARRGRRRSQREIVAGELELLPMINVFIAIIPLLLLSAAFVQVAIIPTSLPGPAEVVPAAAAADPEESGARVRILILPAAFVVEEDGATVLTIPRPGPGAGQAAAADAARAQLRDALGALAAAHAGDREVRIVAEPATRYEDIIDVMDVARAAGLPGAALADASEGVS